MSRKSTTLIQTTVLIGMLAISAVCMAQDSPGDTDARTTKPAASEFSATDVAAVQQLGQSMGIANWLGPLAPVALSPFFGITCLSGMAIYGKGWVAADNPFLSEGSPLTNPTIFVVFLILTLITSIPKLTKVSKPFAQAVDNVEAWAGIITLLVIKVLVSSHSADEAVPVVQLGLISITIDTLLMLAAAINIFVINAVKFFFEMLIWITPIPTLDAIFEVSNKAVCGLLMAIYGYSPVLATGINLAIFAVAAVAFQWTWRREVFLRTMLIDSVWSILAPPKNIPQNEIVVFPTKQLGPFAARSRCRLCRTENGWTLTQQRMLRADLMLQIPAESCRAEIARGYFCNGLTLSGHHDTELTFSRWYNAVLPELTNQLGARLQDADSSARPDRTQLKAELS